MKKSNAKKSIVSGNVVSGNVVSGCIVPDGQKAATRTSPNYYELAFHALNVDLARNETQVSEMKRNYDHAAKCLQTSENVLLMSKNKVNEFNHEMNKKRNQDLVQNKANEFITLSMSIGMPLTEQEAMNKARSVLNIQPSLTVTSVRTRKTRLSVNSNAMENNTLQSTDNELINKIILEYSGAPIGTLPENIKNMFNRTTARKYSAVSCYFQQLQNKDGNGVIADIIRTSTDNETLLNAVNASGLHETTISRFKHAFRLFTS